LQQGQYELDRSRAQLTRQQDQSVSQGREQVQQFRSLARKQAEQQLVNDAIGAVFGTNNAMHTAPLIGSALAGGARPLAGLSTGLSWGGYGSAGRGGLLSMLMGGA
jgi:hypothetical protein